MAANRSEFTWLFGFHLAPPFPALPIAGSGCATTPTSSGTDRGRLHSSTKCGGFVAGHGAVRPSRASLLRSGCVRGLLRFLGRKNTSGIFGCRSSVSLRFRNRSMSHKGNPSPIGNRRTYRCALSPSSLWGDSRLAACRSGESKLLTSCRGAGLECASRVSVLGHHSVLIRTEWSQHWHHCTVRKARMAPLGPRVKNRTGRGLAAGRIPVRFPSYANTNFSRVPRRCLGAITELPQSNLHIGLLA